MQDGKLIEIKKMSGHFMLTWIINNICTNHCDYCPSNLHEGKNHHYEWSHAERFSKFLINKYGKVSLAISGGEPTLSPWYKDLVQLFYENGCSTGVTTNGARSIRYYQDIAKFMSYIVFSHHPSYADPALLDKALSISNICHAHITVMFDSRYFDQALEFYQKIANYPSLSAKATRIHARNKDKTQGNTYTSEQLHILNNLKPILARNMPKIKYPENHRAIGIYDNGMQKSIFSQELINNHQTNFIGWECDIGLESLFVQYNGDVRTGNCLSAKKIGQIQNFENIIWPTKSMICPQTFCDCNTDIYISKRK